MPCSMTANELRQKFLDFFRSKGHTILPSASLVPENDPSVLFTTAGMHPLVPYLLGEKHPGGTRVANVQKCVRTGDIEDVGDNRHLSFFEMLGNWSFGDYFKKEAIEWSLEFLTGKEWLGLDPKRLYITVFKGEQGIPRDEDAITIWKQAFKDQLGMDVSVAGEDAVVSSDVRIIPLGIEDNFWIAGATGPCGGDTEMFYDTRPEEGDLNGIFGELVDSFRLIEVWNNVFMEFNKTADGKFEKLAKQNVDTGMGIERTLAVLEGKENVFGTELFTPLFAKLEELSGMQYGDKSDAEYVAGGKQCWVDTRKQLRIIADHVKTAVFMIADGVVPSNVGRGYVLRRLIRRAIRHGKSIGINNNFTGQIAEVVMEMYQGFYVELERNKNVIFGELEKEENKFRQTLEKGLKEFEKLESITGKNAFDLYQSYGFPLEMTEELAKEKGIVVDKKEFEAEFQNHQDLSRTASAGMFKGGLADTSDVSKKYHTATHLLLAALRQVLGPETYQKGSNITAERLRFDFNAPEKLTTEQLQQVEVLVNQKIQENLAVEMMEMSKDEALKNTKVSFDPSRYGDQVKVYRIADFSSELCGGPHVANTSELGKFKIVKEEASSAGIRRIKAILE